MVESNRTVKIKQLNGPEFDLSVNSEVRNPSTLNITFYIVLKNFIWQNTLKLLMFSASLEDMLFQEF